MTVRSRSAAGRDGAAPAAERSTTPAPVRAVASFESFYHRELKSVIGLAYALSGSRSVAEDLAQDAFLAAHRQWDKIGRYEKPEAWVRRVVSNMSVSLFRRKIREARALSRMRSDESYLPALPAEDEEFWREVRALPRRQAQVIALHYLEDRSVADIADILDCAQGTVKVHLHKGRARLADRMGLELGDER